MSKVGELGEGRIIGYSGGPESAMMREIRESEQRNLRAAMQMRARKARAIIEAANDRQLAAQEAEDEARRALREHAAELAREVEAARDRRQPNPFYHRMGIGLRLAARVPNPPAAR